jgi:hypothetical protein
MNRFHLRSGQLVRSQPFLPTLLLASLLLLGGCANGAYSTATVQSDSPDVSRGQSADLIAWTNSVANAIAARYGRNPLYRATPSGEGTIVAPLDSNHMVGRFTLKTSSGWPEFDAAYVAAANAAGPFPPCPDKTHTMVLEHFHYQPAP